MSHLGYKLAAVLLIILVSSGIFQQNYGVKRGGIKAQSAGQR